MLILVKDHPLLNHGLQKKIFEVVVCLELMSAVWALAEIFHIFAREKLSAIGTGKKSLEHLEVAVHIRFHRADRLNGFCSVLLLRIPRSKFLPALCSRQSITTRSSTSGSALLLHTRPNHRGSGGSRLSASPLPQHDVQPAAQRGDQRASV